MASPQFEMLMDMVRSGALFAAGSPAEMRARMEEQTGLLPPPEGVTFTPVDVSGVSAEWNTPVGTETAPVLLYFHGGGYFMGSVSTHRRFVATLSRAAGIRALSVDYRLAPEHPFPAAVEDATASYRWLVATGVAPERIVIAGDSAGGGLTLAALVALRDAGNALPAAAVAISPVTDLTFAGKSYDTRAAKDPMLTPEAMHTIRDHYLGDIDPATPLASPLWADLAGLPPLLITAGDAEILLDDAVRFVEKALAVGVEAVLEIGPEMIHVWQAFVGFAPESDDGVTSIATFLTKHLGV